MENIEHINGHHEHLKQNSLKKTKAEKIQIL
jgi:hypothetical protein